MIQDRSKAGFVVAASLLALLGAALGLCGCDGGESSSGAGGGTTTTTSCAPGELTRDDGTCQPAGVPADTPAGVPASACGAGFMPDGKDGCEPILPADPCPPGQMAVPGDTECHEVSPCGTGTWGDIPVEANTQFVDQSYAGGDSDGSAEKPWTTIQEGILSADQGAIVAVAAGSYAEQVKIAGKPVQLWGRCPAMVEIVGAGPQGAAIRVLKNTSGTEVHDVALMGGLAGALVSGATDIDFSGVWFHDSDNYGIAIQDDLGTTSVVIERSLVEKNHSAGVLVGSAEATIEATTVRSTLPDAQELGTGIQIQGYPEKMELANVTVRGSVVEQSYQFGINVIAAEATIEATVVRSTLDAPGKGGGGIYVASSPGLRGNLAVVASLIEQNHEAGVVIRGADATIAATVVRSSLSGAMGVAGRGISIEYDADAKERASATVSTSLLEQNHEVGLSVIGSDATIETTAIRSTLPNDQGGGGYGLQLAENRDAKERANATVRACLIEQNRELGVFLSGSDATIETTTVRSTLPNENEKPETQGGRGIDIQEDLGTMEPSKATVRGCLVEQNREIGVHVADSEATIEDSVVRDTTLTSDDSPGGDGICVDYAQATIQNVLVTHNTRAGISNFGGHAQITGAEITCNGFDLDGEPSVSGKPFSFDGSTGWQCSRKAPAACTELGDCSVLTSHLQPPQQLPPVGN